VAHTTATEDVVVLCYHGVSATWPAATTVTPRHLHDHVAAFLQLGYRGATFADALTAPAGRRTIAITFDDALRSVLDSAFPILARLGVPATVFVPTRHALHGEPAAWAGHEMWVGTEHGHELDCLNWSELGQLADAGWEIASHTRSHPRLTTLDGARLRDELAGSKADCEDHLGRRCDSLAYPYSDFDDRVVRAAREAGYLFGATVPRGPRPALPLQWPRVGAYRDEPAARILLRARARRSRPSPTVGALLRARRAARVLRGVDRGENFVNAHSASPASRTVPRGAEEHARGPR
jgi:peptidoglycan/xylan/chitin deacetylase (PgdA/CDA1 family)